MISENKKKITKLTKYGKKKLKLFMKIYYYYVLFRIFLCKSERVSRDHFEYANSLS